MKLKEKYKEESDIPDGYADLYSERKGEFVFTGVEGVLNSWERDDLKSESAGYRIKLREAKTALDQWSGLGEFDQVQETLSSVPELKVLAEGKRDDQKTLEKLVDTRVAGEKARWESQLKQSQTKLEQMGGTLKAYENRARQAAIRDAALEAAGSLKTGKLAPEAIEDMQLFAGVHLQTVEERDEDGNLQITGVVSKDGVGVTPGQDAALWLSEMAERKQHWLSGSSGGGSRGSKGAGNRGNPWSGDADDIDAQGDYIREYGMDKARAAAEAAGKTIG